MIRLLVLVLCLMASMPAQAQVKSYTQAPGTANSAPPWVAEVVASYDDGKLRLKSGRSYALYNNTLVETLRMTGNREVENIFDFDNGVMLVRAGADAVMFAEMVPERLMQVRDYGCYIAMQSRGDEAKFFQAQHCFPGAPLRMKSEGAAP